MIRRLAALVVAVLAVVAMFAPTSCTTAQIDAFLGLNHDQQVAVIDHLDCDDAASVIWPARLQSWVRTIIYRESRGIATAQNATSSSAGCLQLIRSTWLANAPAGCPWSARYQAWCNILVGWLVYQRSGPHAWVTA